MLFVISHDTLTYQYIALKTKLYAYQDAKQRIGRQATD